jgi:hypothetical protein
MPTGPIQRPITTELGIYFAFLKKFDIMYPKNALSRHFCTHLFDSKKFNMKPPPSGHTSKDAHQQRASNAVASAPVTFTTKKLCKFFRPIFRTNTKTPLSKITHPQ